jgi:hypothetical protein
MKELRRKERIKMQSTKTNKGPEREYECAKDWKMTAVGVETCEMGNELSLTLKGDESLELA